MTDSPFLKIPKSEYVTFNQYAFSVWDKYPVTPGHALIIPYRPINSWWLTEEIERTQLFDLVDEVKSIIETTHNPDGYNIGMNNGKVAGQTINHLHIHLIPRYSGDVEDPTGGVRNVIPGKGNYLT
tara:strand:+ start:961 stop:1338 length:378 start_codon:yes stop_codon:yes gene_type:complete